MTKTSKKHCECECEDSTTESKGHRSYNDSKKNHHGGEYQRDAMSMKKQRKLATDKIQHHIHEVIRVHKPAVQHYHEEDKCIPYTSYSVLVAYSAVLAWFIVEKSERSPVSPLHMHDILYVACRTLVIEDGGLGGLSCEHNGPARWEHCKTLVEVALTCFVMEAFMEKNGLTLRGISSEVEVVINTQPRHARTPISSQKNLKIHAHNSHNPASDKKHSIVPAVHERGPGGVEKHRSEPKFVAVAAPKEVSPTGPSRAKNTVKAAKIKAATRLVAKNNNKK